MTASSGRDRGDRRERHVLGPILLVAIGLAVLLWNLGVLRTDLWRIIWPYWPVLLILLGVEALIAGRVAWGAVVLVAVLVAAGSFLFHDLPPSAGESEPTLVRQISQPAGSISNAAIRITYLGGSLRVEDGAPEGMLATGELRGEPDRRVDVRYSERGGTGDLRIEPGRDRRWLRGVSTDESLALQLSQSIPLDLRIEAGAARLSLDLSALRVPDLRIETGASSAEIVLPAQGRTQARIEGGATSLVVTAPPGVAMRVMADGGLSSISVDEQRYPRQGSVYQSPDYETADQRIDLRIEVGAASVTVQ